MNRIIDEVVDSIVKSGLVEVEVSARHVHLTQEQIEILFGEGAQLHPKRMLSQPGQFLSEEKSKAGRKKRNLTGICFGTGQKCCSGRGFYY